MYAVIKTGGKQYRVKEGDLLKVETLPGDVGNEVIFDQVLMVVNDGNVSCGQPVLEKAKVKAEVVEHGRHKKVKIIKFRRRKHHMKQMGHRQNYTQVKILAINE